MAYRKTSAKERKRAAWLYNERGLSSTQVAEIVGCSAGSVLSWAAMYGDGARDRGEARSLRSWTTEAKRKARDMGYEYLRTRSSYKVAEQFGVAQNTALRYLRSEHNPYPYPLSVDDEVHYAV